MLISLVEEMTTKWERQLEDDGEGAWNDDMLAKEGTAGENTALSFAIVPEMWTLLLWCFRELSSSAGRKRGSGRASNVGLCYMPIVTLVRLDAGRDLSTVRIVARDYATPCDPAPLEAQDSQTLRTGRVFSVC